MPASKSQFGFLCPMIPRQVQGLCCKVCFPVWVGFLMLTRTLWYKNWFWVSVGSGGCCVLVQHSRQSRLWLSNVWARRLFDKIMSYLTTAGYGWSFPFPFLARLIPVFCRDLTSLGKTCDCNKALLVSGQPRVYWKASHSPLKFFQVSSSPRWMATFMTFERLFSMHFHKVQFYKRKVCLGFLGHPSMGQHRISQVSKSFLMVGFHLRSCRWWLFMLGWAAHCVQGPRALLHRGLEQPPTSLHDLGINFNSHSINI